MPHIVRVEDAQSILISSHFWKIQMSDAGYLDYFGLLWIFELLNCGLNFVRCTVHQVTKIRYSHSPRHGEVEQQKRLNVKLQADRLTACLDGWKCHRIQGTPKSLKMFASLNRYTKYTMKIQRSCTAMATKIDFGEQHPKGLHWNLVAMDPSFWTHDTSTMLKT